MKKLLLIAVLCAVPFLSGCPITDQGVLAGAQEFFPLAEVLPAHPSMLFIDTHMTGVSDAFLRQVVPPMTARLAGDAQFRLAMSMSPEYRFIVLRCGSYSAVWDMRTGQNSVLNPSQWMGWYGQFAQVIR